MLIASEIAQSSVSTISDFGLYMLALSVGGTIVGFVAKTLFIRFLRQFDETNKTVAEHTSQIATIRQKVDDFRCPLPDCPRSQPLYNPARSFLGGE